MSMDVRDIARAYVDAALAQADGADMAALNAAVIELLQKHNLSREISRFPRAVEAEIRKRFPSVELTTADAADAASVESMHKSVEKAVGKQVQFQHRTDSDLIGGAILRVGDDRYDRSIAGALRALHAGLTSL